MSIALDHSSTNNNNRIEGSGFIRGLSCMIFESPEKNRQMAGNNPGDQRFPVAPAERMMVKKKKAVIVDDHDELDCCSSSSIGRNSDSESNGDDDDGEVQSSYKGPLDTLDALQEVLPIRRGISKFYSGKSKSFTSLADASSASIKEIAKPDDAYTRKRKNLLATAIMMDKSHSDPPKSKVGGISKRLTSSRRPNFNLAGTPTSSSESITSDNSNTSSSSPPKRLPPLHPLPRPAGFNNAWASSQPSPRRAFSLMDLQAANDNHSSSSISNRDEKQKQKHH